MNDNFIILHQCPDGTGVYKVCGIPNLSNEITITSFQINWYEIDIDYYQVINTKTEERLPTHFDNKDDALELAGFMNNHTIPKVKPAPLKARILEALEDIDQSKYDMQNKIMKQKEHIKQLEEKIRYLKGLTKGLQRNNSRQHCKLCELEEKVYELNHNPFTEVAKQILEDKLFKAGDDNNLHDVLLLESIYRGLFGVEGLKEFYSNLIKKM